MHEMAITQGIVDAVCEHAMGRRVCRVDLEIGTLSGVVAEAVLFCFDVVAVGTLAEGARLEIAEIAGVLHCRTCGADVGTEDLILLCPCGSADVEVRAGRELRIRSMEVEQACAQPADARATATR
jgi:hydrogenase nickel incorporation protein HypA/HybF